MELHMTYVYQEFPKWVKGKIVQNAEEEQALLAESSPSAELPAGDNKSEGASATAPAPPAPIAKKQKKGK
jgi:hypothetical protein